MVFFTFLLLTSKPKRSKAESRKVVPALACLFSTQFDLCDFRLQICEFCIKATRVPITLKLWHKRRFHFSLQMAKTGLKAKHSLAALEIPTWSIRSQSVFAKYGCCFTLTAPSSVPSLSFGSWNKVMAKKLDVTLTRKARIRALLSVENSWKGCGIELNINSPPYDVELR